MCLLPLKIIHWKYRVIRPLLFLFKSETIHQIVVNFGQTIGKIGICKKAINIFLGNHEDRVSSKHFGINFKSPVGLSAGFDYNGTIASLVPSLGFGFESIGTVTHSPYEGNPKPRLGRLVKSKALLVNKGFKSLGLTTVLSELRLERDFPYGISIGATNSPETSTTETQIDDIMKSFKQLKDDDKFAYLELNISCPNVCGSGALDNPSALKNILQQIKDLRLNKPLLIKFPSKIDWSLGRELIQIMIDYDVPGVIIGNLAKDRKNPALLEEEVEKCGLGNFSGKPTWEQSNDLISKTYKEFGDKITIIGVGGIFSAADAYEKIKLGASLVQLITGLVFEGPQLVAEINCELDRLLKKDGYDNIQQAVGSYYK